MTRCYFAPGERVTIEGRPFHFRRKVTGERWQLENDLDGELIIKDEAELREMYTLGLLVFRVTEEDRDESLLTEAVDQKLHRDFSDFKKEHQAVAERKFRYLREIEEARGYTKDLRVFAGTVGDKQPPSVITLRRWSNILKEGGGDIRRLVPAYSKRGNRLPRYPKKVTEIAMREIWNTHLSKQKMTQAEALSAVRAAIEVENKGLPENQKLKKPGRRFLEKLIGEVDEYDRMCAREGKAAADRYFRSALQSGECESEPLDRVEIDHTVLDLIVVDPVTYLPLGRPTITLALDRRTRCVLGYHISFDPPSYVQVMRCLAHAIKPKDYVKKKYPQIQNLWPCWGIPQEIVVDNGREFHSKDLEAAVMSLLMTVRYCPVKQPWWKGAVERHFRTLSKSLIHTLPGTTFSNPNERADYDSMKQAAIVMEVLDELLHTWICDVYHQSTHRSTLRSPLSLWRELVNPVRQKLPPSVEMLDVSLSSVEERTLFHYGIELNQLTYNSKELQAVRRRKGGIKVKVRWNRSDLGEVHVLDESTNRYLSVPCTWYSYAKGISLWLHKAIRREAEQKEGTETQAKLDAAKARLRQICKDAMIGKRMTTRKAAARAEAQLRHQDLAIPQVSVVTEGSAPVRVPPKQHVKKPMWSEDDGEDIPVFEITDLAK